MASDVFGTALLLVRKSMNPSNNERITADNWDEVFQELKDQAILAIPTPVLAEIVPQEENDRLIRIASASMRMMYRHLAVQDRLVHLFQNNNLQFVVLKGLAVAKYYPVPGYRSLGDIDIAVLHDDYERARQALLENDYHEMESVYIKHSVYEKDGVIIELHKYFTSTNDVAKALIIENLIQQGIKEVVPCEMEGYRFPVLPPLADGMMLLEHMSQHLESGIGLRHLLDWMVYVSHELPDHVWYTEFGGIAEKAGLNKLAEVATKFCVKYLGLEGIHWCERADVAVCDRLLAHIELRGNFGRKALSSDEKVEKLISINKRLFYWFRYLQRTGLSMPIVRKHRILQPIAWLVRAFMMAVNFMKSGVSLLGFRQALKNSKEIDSFLDELGIRRVAQGHTFWNGKSFKMKK